MLGNFDLVFIWPICGRPA